MSQDGPLSDEELTFVDDQLLEYGSDAGILGLSELDGFLTALASAPDLVPASLWLPELWGYREEGLPWPGETPLQELMALIFRHLNDIVDRLAAESSEIQPIFQQAEDEQGDYLVVEDWCYGYLRGVELGQWPALPSSAQGHLDLIHLFGSEDGAERIQAMSEEHYLLAVEDIAPAAVALYQHFHGSRSGSRPEPRAAPAKATAEPGSGELDRPCPCGSGKPFRKCCLH